MAVHLRALARAVDLTGQARAPGGADVKKLRDYFFAAGHAFGLRQAAGLLEALNVPPRNLHL